MPKSVIYEQRVDGSSFSIAGIVIDDRARRPVLRNHRAVETRRVQVILMVVTQPRPLPTS
jgi:hypothetical protein